MLARSFGMLALFVVGFGGAAGCHVEAGEAAREATSADTACVEVNPSGEATGKGRWAFVEAGNYARRNGFQGGFPNFHEAIYPNRGRVLGTILLTDAAIAEW